MDGLPITAIAQGCAGGFILSVMNLVQDSKRPKVDRTTKDFLYCFLFIAWPVIGGFLVYIYAASGYKLDGLLAFTTGLTAPTTITSLMAKTTPDRLSGSVEQ